MAHRLLTQPDSIAAPASLRRARRRHLAAVLVERADVLDPCDRELILGVLAEGRSIREVIRRRDADPATLDRRARVARRAFQRLIRRMLAPTFEAVRLRSHSWPPAMARVGHACFIQGHSMRRAAVALGMSLYNIRRFADAIRTAAATPLPTRDRAA